LGSLLLHFDVDLPCPVVTGAGDGLGSRHGRKVGHVAEAGVGGCRWAEAVIPLALGITDRRDLSGSWLRRGGGVVGGERAAWRGHFGL
jgi:hypothetical protein